MAEYWESEFIESLKAAGKDNMELSGDSSRDQALENIAKPIIEAIKKGGSTIKVVGSATCNQINVMYGMQAGDIWSIKDNGIIVNEDGSSFNACSGDLVLYDGEKWNSFLHLDLSGYVTDDYFDDVIAAINAAIIGHAENKVNPHDVTAEQVGAYTKVEVDAKIAEVEKNHLDMCVNSDVVEFFTVAS